MRLILFFLVVFFGCSTPKGNVQEKEKTQYKSDSFKGLQEDPDECILEKTEVLDKLLDLDDEGNLRIDSLNFEINLITRKDESYDLKIFHNSKLVFNQSKIEGISKVFVDKNSIMLSVFTVFTEDGNNEGFAIIYDFPQKILKVNKKNLINTCNPIILNKSIYLLENLTLKRVDESFKLIDEIKINYKSQTDSTEYLDTYLICGLSITNNKFILKFTDNKSKKNCTSFSGLLAEKVKRITIIEN